MFFLLFYFVSNGRANCEHKGSNVVLRYSVRFQSVWHARKQLNVKLPHEHQRLETAYSPCSNLNKNLPIHKITFRLFSLLLFFLAGRTMDFFFNHQSIFLSHQKKNWYIFNREGVNACCQVNLDGGLITSIFDAQCSHVTLFIHNTAALNAVIMPLGPKVF